MWESRVFDLVYASALENARARLHVWPLHPIIVT